MEIYFLLLQKIEVKICSIISYMMFFLFPFSRCCQRHSWPVMLFYFTPSVIRFDVVVSLMVVFIFAILMLGIYINKFWILLRYWYSRAFLFVINTVKFSEKFLMCDCYLFIFMLFLLKLRMVTQLEMKKLLFVERWKIIPVYFICSEQIYRNDFDIGDILSENFEFFQHIPIVFPKLARKCSSPS